MDGGGCQDRLSWHCMSEAYVQQCPQRLGPGTASVQRGKNGLLGRAGPETKLATGSTGTHKSHSLACLIFHTKVLVRYLPCPRLVPVPAPPRIKYHRLASPFFRSPWMFELNKQTHCQNPLILQDKLLKDFFKSQCLTESKQLLKGTVT